MLTIAASIAFAIWLVIHSNYLENQFNQIKKDLDYIKDKLDEQT